MGYNEKIERALCNFCGENNTKLLFAIQDKTSLRDKTLFNIVQCKKCRLIYINPRPSESTLASYYPIDYYAHQPSFIKNSFLSSPTTRVTLKKFYGYNDLNLNGVKKSHILLSFFKRKQLENIPSYIRGGKILDVGCGNGAYLYKLEELGWQTFGVEISKNACEYARQNFDLNVFCGDLLEANFPNNYFDIVTIWHTLEHLPDPTRTLMEIKRILKNKGFLYIGIPNVDSLEAKIFGGNWFHLDVPRHLYNFSEKTLSQLLSKTGFKIQRVKYCGYGSFGLIGSIDNVLQSVSIKSNLKNSRIAHLITKIPYLVLVFLKQSGCIEVVASKEGK